ncbi:hypothetical protein POK33_39515 [Burkholderia cenocepacia]|uniref:hypothetical protein n=1 Tax=Burkholderia cenocepacia TaxID=95486 RepID=UPI0023B9370C|nr:hypothetical protein [Burkholderia cenocepacia]MDF0506844.1 hypothetical protein [Burkholderia cenocepacia]
MHKHFDTIERELKAAIETAGPDLPTLIDRLDRLLNDVRGARFAAGHALFGKGMKPGGPPAEEIAGVAPPPRKFGHDDTVRTKDGYLARVAHYDEKGRVVVNVLFQACEYSESDLRAVDL